MTDDNNNRVQQFTAKGAYVAKFGGVGTGAGQLKTPTGVAVYGDQGTIIVMDSGNNRVSQWWPTPSPNYGRRSGASVLATAIKQTD